MSETTTQVYRSVDGNWREVAPGQPIVRLYESVSGWRIVEPQRRLVKAIPGHTLAR